VTLYRYLLTAVITVVAAAPAAATTGSWVANALNLRLPVADRLYRSPPLTTGNVSACTGRHITQVAWRYHLEASTPVQGWLCAGDHCVALRVRRGTTQDLAGISADTPLEFRFRSGGRAMVKDMRVIVHYR